MPPVEDHEVHEKVKVGADFRYGCNTVRRKSVLQPNGYFAPNRVYGEDGTYSTELVFIKNQMSKPCRSFYLWDTDPACADCREPRDHKYAETMKGLA